MTAPRTETSPIYTSVLVDHAYSRRCGWCGGSGFEFTLNGHVTGVCRVCDGTGVDLDGAR